MCQGTACLSPGLGVAASTFVNAIQYFLTHQCLIPQKWPEDYKAKDSEVFDVIIIGSGSSGSVLANRLSEIEQWNILLVEAGGDPPVESDVPFFDNTMPKSGYDWNYTSSDNGITNKANVNNIVSWTRGKMLGGCSSNNAMLYVQGNDNDFQSWYDAGLREWDPTTVRKYFRKAESFQDMKLLNNSAIRDHYGLNGPLAINTFNSTHRDIYDKVLSAWDEMGIKTVPDLNAAKCMGSAICRVTAADGVRQSTAHAYLNTVKNRKNLKIMKNALATKVLVTKNNDSYTAKGVEVHHDGTTKTFYANKEVIISAGTVNSPQLLMLSGIGSKEHLESKNIKCLVDLPMVGQNLHDHCIVPITIYGSEPGYTNVAEQNLNVLKYISDRTGHLAHSSYSDITAHYAVNKNATTPMFQNNMILFMKNSSSVAEYFSKYKSSVENSVVELNYNNAMYMFTLNLLHPNSRGHITLRTNDPNDHPVIYWNNFEDPSDIESAVKGIKILTQIVYTEYFKSINGFLGRMNWTTCNDYALDSEEYWACICVNMATTMYHPVGTCTMGTSPSNAVLDSRLKVFGFDNLRVIDASAMPTTVSGNTNAACIMLGERGADIIKEDYNMC